MWRHTTFHLVWIFLKFGFKKTVTKNHRDFVFIRTKLKNFFFSSKKQSSILNRIDHNLFDWEKKSLGKKIFDFSQVKSESLACFILEKSQKQIYLSLQLEGFLLWERILHEIKNETPLGMYLSCSWRHKTLFWICPRTNTVFLCEESW